MTNDQGMEQGKREEKYGTPSWCSLSQVAEEKQEERQPMTPATLKFVYDPDAQVIELNGEAINPSIGVAVYDCSWQVGARQMPSSFSVNMGPMCETEEGEPGDWLVVGPGNVLSVVKSKEFRSQYALPESK